MVTAAVARNRAAFTRVRVESLRTLSPTVRLLNLRALEEEKDAELAFRAGQWLDCKLPGVDALGGFSICSTPAAFRSERRLELAVKKSAHPPAAWLHSAHVLGQTIEVRAGGDFVYEPEGDHHRSSALFVCGGIGVNPLLSMVRERFERAAALPAAAHTTLLMSAKSPAELVFRRELEELARAHAGRLRLGFFVTQQPPEAGDAAVQSGRVSAERLCAAVAGWEAARSFAFVCGPPRMLDDVSEALVRSCGFAAERVLSEKWW